MREGVYFSIIDFLFLLKNNKILNFLTFFIFQVKSYKEKLNYYKKKIKIISKYFFINNKFDSIWLMSSKILAFEYFTKLIILICASSYKRFSN